MSVEGHRECYKHFSMPEIIGQASVTVQGNDCVFWPHGNANTDRLALGAM